jgi:hypothetical protein
VSRVVDNRPLPLGLALALLGGFLAWVDRAHTLYVRRAPVYAIGYILAFIGFGFLVYGTLEWWSHLGERGKKLAQKKTPVPEAKPPVIATPEARWRVRK